MKEFDEIFEEYFKNKKRNFYYKDYIVRIDKLFLNLEKDLLKIVIKTLLKTEINSKVMKSFNSSTKFEDYNTKQNDDLTQKIKSFNNNYDKFLFEFFHTDTIETDEYFRVQGFHKPTVKQQIPVKGIISMHKDEKLNCFLIKTTCYINKKL